MLEKAECGETEMQIGHQCHQPKEWQQLWRALLVVEEKGAVKQLKKQTNEFIRIVEEEEENFPLLLLLLLHDPNYYSRSISSKRSNTSSGGGFRVVSAGFVLHSLSVP